MLPVEATPKLHLPGALFPFGFGAISSVSCSHVCSASLHCEVLKNLHHREATLKILASSQALGDAAWQTAPITCCSCSLLMPSAAAFVHLRASGWRFLQLPPEHQKKLQQEGLLKKGSFRLTSHLLNSKNPRVNFLSTSFADHFDRS